VAERSESAAHPYAGAIFRFQRGPVILTDFLLFFGVGSIPSRKYWIAPQLGGARGSIVVKALCYIRKVACSGPDEVNFSKFTSSFRPY
jgi:hypothetical protein